jgi:hypothetical protein
MLSKHSTLVVLERSSVGSAQCWLPTLLLMLTHPKLVSLDTTILLERKPLCLLVSVAGFLLIFHAVVGIACMLEFGMTCHECLTAGQQSQHLM